MRLLLLKQEAGEFAELFTRNAPLVSAFCRYELGDAASSSAIVLL